MEVYNLMEDIVRGCLKDLLHHQSNALELGVKEQSDVMAIVLNRLPAKYVSTQQGEVFAKTQLRSQMETDVYRELSYAIEKVTQSDRPSELKEKD